MPATVDQAFAVLADPTRRQIVALLARRPYAVGELCTHFAVSQPAVSRHLRVLRESGVVTVHPGDDKRERRYALRGDGLTTIEAWIEAVARSWQIQLISFARHAESEARHDRRGAR